MADVEPIDRRATRGPTRRFVAGTRRVTGAVRTGARSTARATATGGQRTGRAFRTFTRRDGADESGECPERPQRTHPWSAMFTT